MSKKDKPNQDADEPRLVKDLEDEESLDIDETLISRKYDKAQRELVTQSVDFSIRTLADMVAGGQIDTNPKYQRRLRWDERRRSRLIESFLMNVPIPPLFLAEEEYGKYAVIDGQQRLRAIQAFFANEFQLKGVDVFSEIEGRYFSELPAELQSVLLMRPTMRCIIIQRQSDPEIKFEVFERLNTGGVRLNAQEIRNSAYRGPFNDLIIELSEGGALRAMLKVKNPEHSHLVQYMRDCELVLRFFMLKDSWRTFSGSMQGSLNSFMRSKRMANRGDLGKYRADFTGTLETVHEAFGEIAFLRWDPHRESWSKAVLASMFDAQMLACYQHIGEPLAARQQRLVGKLKKLFSADSLFMDAIRGQTNTPTKLVYRVDKVLSLL